MKQTMKRPANGCARCVWWKQLEKTPRGMCYCLAEDMWYQHGPCDEYEKRLDVPDEIEVDV